MISLPAIANFLAALAMAAFALLVYVGDKSENTRVYGRYAAVNALLALAFGFLLSVDPSHTDIRLILVRASYWIGYVIASTYFYFALVFPRYGEKYKAIRLFLLAIDAIFFYLYIFTNLVVKNFSIGTEATAIQAHFGPLGPILFNGTYLILVTAALTVLYRKWRAENEPVQRKQNGILFALAFVDFGPSSFVAVVLPLFGDANLSWSAPLLNLIWIALVSFVIYRKSLFRVRVVASELLVIALLVILFLNIFSNEIQYAINPTPTLESTTTPPHN